MRTGELIMNVLVIDIGGTNVKVLATGQDAHREFDSGPALTPKRMVSGVRKLVADWNRGILEKDGAGSTSKRHSNARSRC
jgi:hypothetical protein